MARYINEMICTADPRTVFEKISAHLSGEGYEYLTYKGENLFKKEPYFIKLSFAKDIVRLEAWVKSAFGRRFAEELLGQKVICLETMIGSIEFEHAIDEPSVSQEETNVKATEENLSEQPSAQPPLQTQTAPQFCPPQCSPQDYSQTPYAPAYQPQYAPIRRVFCINCGKEVTGARFCQFCGNPVI